MNEIEETIRILQELLARLKLKQKKIEVETDREHMIEHRLESIEEDIDKIKKVITQ